MAERVARRIQAMNEQGLFSTRERCFLIASLGDAIEPSRAREDPRFDEVDRAMDRVKREHGLTDEEDWHLDEAPEEYLALDREWRAIAERELAAWFESMGERELAYLIAHDHEALFERLDEGRRELAGR